MKKTVEEGLIAGERGKRRENDGRKGEGGRLLGCERGEEGQ